MKNWWWKQPNLEKKYSNMWWLFSRYMAKVSRKHFRIGTGSRDQSAEQGKWCIMIGRRRRSNQKRKMEQPFFTTDKRKQTKANWILATSRGMRFYGNSGLCASHHAMEPHTNRSCTLWNFLKYYFYLGKKASLKWSTDVAQMTFLRSNLARAVLSCVLILNSWPLPWCPPVRRVKIEGGAISSVWDWNSKFVWQGYKWVMGKWQKSSLFFSRFFRARGKAVEMSWLPKGPSPSTQLGVICTLGSAQVWPICPCCLAVHWG